ncbi:MAG TPA: 2-dehydropantoate 2-reductase [Bacteroidales bacterium]|nr:2-dehydropantoate 2-reductase [Bacteroidales bacterium]
MKIAIIGSGGVGGYFGGKLAEAGFDVTFFARGEHLSTMRKVGLTVKSILGDFHIKNISATDNLRDIEPVDLIIFATKAWQIKELAPGLKPIVRSGTTILPLQNGVLAASELQAFFNPSQIVGGLCRIISKIEAPGVINHFGVTPTIVFGELDKTISERTRKIKAVFDKAGINSQISIDIEADLWKKFISICVSGLLAITRSTYGELRELKETRGMMIGLLNEIYALSQKMGINVEPDFVNKTVSYIDNFPYDSSSSLARDVWEGKPSEIEYQNGTVVKLAAEHGVDVPINSFVYNCILPMERRARKKQIQ